MTERFWAKTGKGEFKEDGQPEYHPVICHLADTAAVAMEIVRSYLSQSAINTLKKGLGIQDQESLIRCCGFLAGCHDLGKVSPAFQFQVSKVGKALLGDNLYDLWLKMPDRKTPHGLVTAKTMPEFLLDSGIGSHLTKREASRLARRLAIIVGGHHGFFPSLKEIEDLDDELCGIDENSEWRLQRFSQRIFEQLRKYVKLTETDFPTDCDNAAAMILAGLTTVSDWIASDPKEKGGFPYKKNDVSFEEYQVKLSDLAKNALEQMGWMKAKKGQELTFAELFPKNPIPRPLQDAAIDLSKALAPPCLVMVEASMGEGKTEAALYLADYLQHQTSAGGFYIGLPTQATSNAMWARVKEFLGKRYQDEKFVNLTLSHSAASLKDDYYNCRLEEQVYDDDGKRSVKVVVSKWHSAKRRTLLTPYGVGTLDQGLMGVVRSKWQFVRLFGLAGRTVILDEIHAYDLYTSTLLEMFLEWLAVLGSPVIALSATLPKETRQKLLSAYAKGCGYSDVKLPLAKYPRITTFSGGKPDVFTFEASKHLCRSLNIEWKKDSEWKIALKEKLVSGGCVAVICSTVGRAQMVFRELQSYFVPKDELGLFHGRFLFVDRDTREKKCLEDFGKESTTRPEKYVLVTTQVIEQSLDVDFDLMISYIAPIDLLLQRSGRLHRHEERNKNRPKLLKQPTMWLVEPTLNDEGKPNFQESEIIYNRHILLRTWLALRDRSYVQLPAEMDDLVESVYHLKADIPEDLDSIHQQDWQASLADYLTGDISKKISAANAVKLPPAPPESDPYDFTRAGTEDDDNTVAKVTRLGDPTVTTIFLQQTDKGFVFPGTDEQVEPDRTPDFPTIQKILSYSTRIGTRGLVQALAAEHKVPSKWNSALLRYCAYIVLDSTGKAQVDKWELARDPDLGIVINRL
jgi:CRISPR-associated endonuclease/helicase Cas3